jgi:hypothetical protein
LNFAELSKWNKCSPKNLFVNILVQATLELNK